MIIEKNDHFTAIRTQGNDIIVCNSTMNDESIFKRSFAQLRLREDADETCTYITDEAIDELIEALQNAKTKK